jgi:signal transduction histidine kinase
VEFLYKKDRMPGPINADYERVGEVVNNLINNAIKFSPRKGTISIDIKRISKENRWFRELSVTDQGNGVPENKRKYLFEKYHVGSEHKKYKGTGLGLAVSRLIVETHGGVIGYKPAPGGGSIFYFYLPEG